MSRSSSFTPTKEQLQSCQTETADKGAACGKGTRKGTGKKAFYRSDKSPGPRGHAGGSRPQAKGQPRSSSSAQDSYKYRLCAEDIADDKVIIYRAELAVAADLENALPDAVSRKMGCRAWEVEADGDGACGIHALCGAPTARGKLRCRDARAFAQRHLSLPLSQLKERVDPAILKKVSAGIWPDLVVKVLEYEDGTSTAGLTTEQVIFWDVFQSETYKDVVVEAKARYTYNRGSALAKREATAALMYQARGVFAAEELACVWQPLAVQCRPHPVLPPLPLPLAHASAEAILEEQRHEDSKRYDFLCPLPKTSFDAPRRQGLYCRYASAYASFCAWRTHAPCSIM